jgi:hypothetical protein
VVEKPAQGCTSNPAPGGGPPFLGKREPVPPCGGGGPTFRLRHYSPSGSGAVWFSCSAIYLSRPAMDDQSSPQGNNIISRG